MPTGRNEKAGCLIKQAGFFKNKEIVIKKTIVLI